MVEDEGRPSPEKVCSQSLQNMSVRIDLAFKRFFRRVNKGRSSGLSTIQGKGSVSLDHLSSIEQRMRSDRLRLANVRTVSILLHRFVEEAIKTCTVLRSSTEKDSFLPSPPGRDRCRDQGLRIFVGWSENPGPEGFQTIGEKTGPDPTQTQVTSRMLDHMDRPVP